MSRSKLASLLANVPTHAPYRRYLVASYADNTKRAYEGDVTHFRAWGGRIPATPMQLARYLAAYAGTQAFATLSRRVAGIHREHVARGLKSPAASELVRATLRGIARTYSRRQRKVSPLSTAHLRKMLFHMRGVGGLRDKALLLVGFFGGFRRSELAALDIEDLEFGRLGVSITVRKSKTDQDAMGRTVRIPKLKGRLCPIRALKLWLGKRGASGPLFTGISRGGRINARRLYGHAVAAVVKQYVALIGLERDQFSGHSIRAGFVTAAAQAGAAGWQIREQTGHKSDAVLAGYIRAGAATGSSVARLVAAN
jgi:integrase